MNRSEIFRTPESTSSAEQKYLALIRILPALSKIYVFMFCYINGKFELLAHLREVMLCFRHSKNKTL